MQHRRVLPWSIATALVVVLPSATAWACSSVDEPVGIPLLEDGADDVPLNTLLWRHDGGGTELALHVVDSGATVALEADDMFERPAELLAAHTTYRLDATDFAGTTSTSFTTGAGSDDGVPAAPTDVSVDVHNEAGGLQFGTGDSCRPLGPYSTQPFRAAFVTVTAPNPDDVVGFIISRDGAPVQSGAEELELVAQDTDPERVIFSVASVDRAGNRSPSLEFDVDFGPVGGGGCSSAGTSDDRALWAVLGAVLVGVRRRRRV